MKITTPPKGELKKMIVGGVALALIAGACLKLADSGSVGQPRQASQTQASPQVEPASNSARRVFIGHDYRTKFACFAVKDADLFWRVKGMHDRGDNAAINQLALAGDLIIVPQGAACHVQDQKLSDLAQVQIQGSADLVWMLNGFLE